MWDFEHPPHSSELAQRYSLNYTQPSQCAEDLLSGRADLGLIPIAALTPALSIVPGCTIASLDYVRSIQLIIKSPCTLETVKSIAADTASRSSLAYTEILFRKFLGTNPTFLQHPADPVAMLQHADAALLIGDPALLALEARSHIEASVGPCTWIDLAHEWRIRTGLPWVAAVWAARPETLGNKTSTNVTPQQLIHDLDQSRIHGQANIDTLVAQWTHRIALPPSTIHQYLTQNIHYTLDPDCIEAITLFRRYAAEINALSPLPQLTFLDSRATSASQPAS